jgi:hypothetical protein
VIVFAVSTMVTARAKHMVQRCSSSDDEVQLVPVLRHGMSPRHSVVGLGVIEGVGDCEIIEGAVLKKSLFVLV